MSFYCRLQHSGAHSLEVLPYPFQCRDSGIETRELLLDGSDDPPLFPQGRQGNAYASNLGCRQHIKSAG